MFDVKGKTKLLERGSMTFYKILLLMFTSSAVRQKISQPSITPTNTYAGLSSASLS
jgi:hypothetical protein